MTSYRIALNFEDGVTRFIDCGAHEKVLDSAFRQRINLPMDCSDGVCGTCKCRAESGSYDMGDDYIEDALTQDEASRGLVLTCQMVPSSDCVISVPVPSTACKTGTSQFSATVNEVLQFGDAAYELVLDSALNAPGFLPGQYVNIGVPGSDQHRSYSFSSGPDSSSLRFLIKQVPGGLMSTWLSAAQPAQRGVSLGRWLGRLECPRAVQRYYRHSRRCRSAAGPTGSAGAGWPTGDPGGRWGRAATVADRAR